MKKLILFTVMTLPFFGVLRAQEYDNVLKINAFGALVGQYQIGYERALNEHSTVQLSVGFISLESSQTFITDSYESTTSGFIFIPEYRYYFSDAPVKFYTAPFARLRLVTENLDDTSDPIGTDVSYKDNTTTIGGGLVLGGQWVFADAVSMDIFIGPQFKSKSTKRTYEAAGVTDDDFDNKFLDFKVKEKSGFGVRFGLNLGFAF